MIKPFVSIGFSCLAFGSIIGYAISELTRSPQLQAQNSPGPIATANKKATLANRLRLLFVQTSIERTHRVRS
jgi:hypothetical protein